MDGRDASVGVWLSAMVLSISNEGLLCCIVVVGGWAGISRMSRAFHVKECRC